MIKNDDLQTIKRTHTAQALLSHFKNKQRPAPDTHLEALKSYMLKHGKAVSNQDFYIFFHDMEDIGAGEFVEARGNKEAIFKWYYDHKDLAKQALEPHKTVAIKEIDQVKSPRKRGRPLGYSPKAAQVVPNPDALAQPGLFYVYRTKSGQIIQLNLNDAESLVRDYHEKRRQLG